MCEFLVKELDSFADQDTEPCTYISQEVMPNTTAGYRLQELLYSSLNLYERNRVLYMSDLCLEQLYTGVIFKHILSVLQTDPTYTNTESIAFVSDEKKFADLLDRYEPIKNISKVYHVTDLRECLNFSPSIIIYLSDVPPVLVIAEDFDA